MTNTVHIQTNFTAGEISPRLFGRVDLSKYNNGAKKIENALVQVHGGLVRRAGTRYANEVKHHARPPRLVEFQYNAEQSYILEIGADHDTNEDTGYIRFFRVDANGLPYRLIDVDPEPDVIVELSSRKWSNADVPYLRFVQSADTMYIFNGGNSSTDVGNPTLKLRRIGADDEIAGWECNQLQTEATGTGSGGTNTFIDGPYLDMNAEKIFLQCTEAPIEIEGTQTVQAYNGVSGTGKEYPFRQTDRGRLIRIEDATNDYQVIAFDKKAATSAEGADITVSGGGLYDAITEGYTGGASAKVEFFDFVRGPTFLDGTIHEARDLLSPVNVPLVTTFELFHALTAENEPYAEAAASYDEEGIQGKVKIKSSSNIGWGVITKVLDASDDDATIFSQAEITVKKKFIDRQRTQNWRLGAWSQTTGYPSNGAFHQGRFWAANSQSQPDTIWASETNVFDTFSPSDTKTSQVVDSSALTVTLASKQVNAVNQLKSDSQGLLIFTKGGEWLGRATNVNAPLTPSDMSFTKQSSFGSSSLVDTVRIGTSYLSVQRDRGTVREYSYEFSSDRFNAPSATLLAEHISRNKIKEATVLMGQSHRYWGVTDTGELVSMTFEKEQNVIAWSKHKMSLSGTGGNANTVGLVQSVARSTDSDDDNLWLLVKRKIGSATDGSEIKYYIEMMVNEFEADDDHQDAFFVESGLSGSSGGAGTTIWTGLDHLNGEVVYALADSIQRGPLTVGSVTGGIGVTLPVNANNVIVGLKYKTIIETVPLNITQSLETRAKRKRIFSAFVNMYRSLSGKIGTPDQLYDLEYSAATSSPPELKTEMAEVSFPDNSDREMIIRFEQDDVHPSNILSITSEIAVGI